MNFTSIINGVGLYSEMFPIRTYKKMYEDTASNSMVYNTIVSYRGTTFNFNDIACLIVKNQINMEEAYLALITRDRDYLYGYDELDELDNDTDIAHIAHNAKESGVEW